MGRQENTKIPKNEPVIQFSYDNTNEEIDGAMKTFQKRFMSKKGGIWIVAYVFIFAAIAVGIFFNRSSVVLYVALGICIFGFAVNITEKKRTRNKVIRSLKNMAPETYVCTIYPNKIEIDTTIINSESDGGNSNFEENGEDKPIVSVFTFDEYLLNFSENNESLLLIVNRRQIYCFPKRCLSEEQQNIVRDFLTDKLESDEF